MTYTGPRKGYPKTVTNIRRWRWEQAFKAWLLAGCPEQPTLMPVAASPQLRQTERLVLVWLATFADFDTGNNAHPGHRELAILADLSVEANPKGGRPSGVKRVSRVLVDAERLGWVECFDRKAYNGKAKGYRLAVPWWWVQVLTEQGDWYTEKGVPEEVPQSGERGTSRGPEGVPPEVPPPSLPKGGGSARPARRSLPPTDEPVSVSDVLPAEAEHAQEMLAEARANIAASRQAKIEEDAAARRQREQEQRAKADALKELYPDQFAQEAIA